MWSAVTVMIPSELCCTTLRMKALLCRSRSPRNMSAKSSLSTRSASPSTNCKVAASSSAMTPAYSVRSLKFAGPIASSAGQGGSDRGRVSRATGPGSRLG